MKQMIYNIFPICKYFSNIVLIYSQQICISWKRPLIRPLWPFGPILEPAKQFYDGIWFLLKIIVCNSYILCVPLYIALVILYGSEIN